MTDEKYTFIQDVKEKKTIGHSAAKRVGKRKKVTFPSDNLTKKEIEKMSGEVKTYNLKQPMKWAEFKTMPDDLRKEYITRLIRLYNASNIALGKMLGVSDNCVRVERKRLGIPPCPKHIKTAPEFYNFAKYGTPGPVDDKPVEEDKVTIDPLELDFQPVQVLPLREETKPKPPTVELLAENYHRALGIIEGISFTALSNTRDALLTALEILSVEYKEA